MDGEPRTNNSVEAAHRSPRTELSVGYSNLYAFVDGIRKSQAARDREYQQFIGVIFIVEEEGKVSEGRQKYSSYFGNI